MSKDGLIHAFDKDIEKYKTCMLTKITKKPFPNAKHETKVLELIHSDLCDLHATPSLGNKKYFVTFIYDASRFCYVYLLHTKDEALDKFKVFKTEVELQQSSQIKRFRTDRGCQYMDTLYFQSVGIIHETTTPYTPQQDGITERKNRLLKEMRHSYAEHSKAFRFYVIEPNDLVSINSIIESRDAIFDENRFSSVPRPSLKIPNGNKDISGSVVPEDVTKEVVQQPEPELRKSKRNRTPKAFRPEFQLYLIEGTRDEVSGQHSYCFNVEDDPKTFDEAMKSRDVDGTIEKFKARLVIQGFKQNSGIDYFDTYAPVACISTIRLLIAMASIHNLIIYQMDMKTDFLNGELDEEHTPKQWHQKFDEVVLSNGYLLNQADKCVYRKFDETGCPDKGIFVIKSHYIEKVLKKFNYFDCTPVSTPIDTSEKLMPNNGQAVSQVKYSKVIGCLIYAMTYTRPDITFVVGKLSRYTINPGTQHWQAIQRVLKYLKKTMDYRLTYTSYTSVLEGYTNASWISNTKDNSYISGWVFLLGGGAISC
ncbi:zinc finger, CCHC-type containing protein [Tanacetum coccineum]